MHNRTTDVARSHCDALFGHLAINKQAINDQMLVETACNIYSFSICSVLQSW